jgi:hypothetical protein
MKFMACDSIQPSCFMSLYGTPFLSRKSMNCWSYAGSAWAGATDTAEPTATNRAATSALVVRRIVEFVILAPRLPLEIAQLCCTAPSAYSS